MNEHENNLKKFGESLAHAISRAIAEKDAEIAMLKEQIRAKDQRIAELEAEVAAFEQAYGEAINTIAAIQHANTNETRDG
jgi:uncharacterized coiled-coil protein SlyX